MSDATITASVPMFVQLDRSDDRFALINTDDVHMTPRGPRLAMPVNGRVRWFRLAYVREDFGRVLTWVPTRPMKFDS